jgi:hypothetical protein
MREMTTSLHQRPDIQALQMTTRLHPNDIFAEPLQLLEATEIVGPAAKLAVTVSVDLCRFPR